MSMQKILRGALIIGAVWVTVEAAVYIFHAASEMSQPLQPSYGQQNWLSLEEFYSLLQILLGFLVFAVILAHPVGIWSLIARRRLIRRRLAAVPAPHGKYLPWGRNLRRHASIPKRHSGQRPRKAFRPMPDADRLR